MQNQSPSQYPNISNGVHNSAFRLPPPPTGSVLLVQKLIDVYKLWHGFLPHIPKTPRYTLGQKIDSLLLETIELVFTASYLSKPQKRPFVQKASAKLDMLKMFLRLVWEVKGLDNKKYITLSEKLDEIGRMLGGWNRQING